MRMKLMIFSALVAVCLSKPMSQSLAVHGDGTYQFFYETGHEGGSHSRSESRDADGVVIGKYSYEDPNGAIREVNYRADGTGFVANGDIGVDGAPKSQLPSTPPKNSTVETAEADITSEPEEEERKELLLEEASEDTPPDGFPQGFFVHHFQGLRRLPEPTKAEEATEATTTPEDQSIPPVAETNNDTSSSEGVNPNLSASLRPFPGFAHPEWATAMFREPVYVFSYQQPDSYGYHYFF